MRGTVLRGRACGCILVAKKTRPVWAEAKIHPPPQSRRTGHVDRRRRHSRGILNHRLHRYHGYGGVLGGASRLCAEPEGCSAVKAQAGAVWVRAFAAGSSRRAQRVPPYLRSKNTRSDHSESTAKKEAARIGCLLELMSIGASRTESRKGVVSADGCSCEGGRSTQKVPLIPNVQDAE